MPHSAGEKSGHLSVSVPFRGLLLILCLGVSRRLIPVIPFSGETARTEGNIVSLWKGKKVWELNPDKIIKAVVVQIQRRRIKLSRGNRERRKET